MNYSGFGKHFYSKFVEIPIILHITRYLMQSNIPKWTDIFKIMFIYLISKKKSFYIHNKLIPVLNINLEESCCCK